MNAALATLLLFVALDAHAQVIGNVAPPPQTGYAQHLGARLPLDAPLLDEHDRPVTLRRYFGAAPVVLVLGYFHCPNLCQTVGAGVLEALGGVTLAKRDYQVVMVSIDPRENAALAARKKAEYAAADHAWSSRLHLLRGPAAAQIARTAGFHYRYDRALDQYIHPAGFLIASADGRISRYFFGVRYAPRDVRLALVEAAHGRLGSPADHLLLLCSCYDPHAGRYTVRVMTVVRAIALTLLAVLVVWLWRHRKGASA
jgi:protein SCO1/2